MVIMKKILNKLLQYFKIHVLGYPDYSEVNKLFEEVKIECDNTPITFDDDDDYCNDVSVYSKNREIIKIDPEKIKTVKKRLN